MACSFPISWIDACYDISTFVPTCENTFVCCVSASFQVIQMITTAVTSTEKSIGENAPDPSARCSLAGHEESSEGEDELDRTIRSVVKNGSSNGIKLLRHGANLDCLHDPIEWDKDFIKQVIRKVKNRRLSQQNAAVKLSEMMNRKVSVHDIRIEVMKLVAAEAKKNSEKKTDARIKKSSSTSSQTLRTSCSSQPSNSQAPCVMVLSDESQPSTSELSKMALVSVPASPQGLLYIPIITSASEPPRSNCANIPPFVKILNAKGELTHIALAENGRYRTYQLAESLDYSSGSTTPALTEVASDNDVQHKIIEGLENVPDNEETLASVLYPERPCKVSNLNDEIFYVEEVGNDRMQRQTVDDSDLGGEIVEVIDDPNFSENDTYGVIYETANESLLEQGDERRRFIETDAASSNDYEQDCVVQERTTLNSILQNVGPGTRGAPYTRLLNVRGVPSNIAVAESGGFRVYRLSSTRSNREYYRCSRCDSLRTNEHDPVGAIKLVNGVIQGSAHPHHHPDCLIQSMSSIVAKEFDRQARREVAEGYLTPRQAWCRGQLRALEAQERAGDLVTARDYPDWTRVRGRFVKRSRNWKVSDITDEKRGRTESIIEEDDLFEPRDISIN